MTICVYDDFLLQYYILFNYLKNQLSKTPLVLISFINNWHLTVFEIGQVNINNKEL